MKKILVAGAAGGLGNEVLTELKKRNYFVRALVSSEDDLKKIINECDEAVIGDALDYEVAAKATKDIDIVFSAIGKSLSLFSENGSSFKEIDYDVNKNLLDHAAANKVKRFVYVSVYGSDMYGDFELAKQHRDVEKALYDSGLSYTVIRPVAIFVGLLDLLKMANYGAVVTVGEGNNKVNPIHEKDLAIVCADNIEEGTRIVEAGGPITYTRNEIAEIVCNVKGRVQHIHIPVQFADGLLSVLNMFNENFFHKLAFFNNVLTNDVVAKPHGTRDLIEYLEEMKDKV